jgi:glycogen debranching enzyme
MDEGVAHEPASWRGAGARLLGREPMSARVVADDDTALLESCTRESLRLLTANLTERGILAARRSDAADARRYTRIFGRDAAICTLAMAGSGVEALEQGALAGLDALAAAQAPNGQIPKYVECDGAGADFWYIGCIDATLWWLIAVDCARRASADPSMRTRWQQNVERALAWLRAQEHQRFFLLQQNEASDWADIMPRSGFVLYTNALWYRVKVLFDLPERDATHHHFNALFHPFGRDLPDYRRTRLLRHYTVRTQRNRGLYLSFVNLSFAGDEGDVFGNLLAIFYGLAGDSRAHEILQALLMAGVSDPYPIRSVTRPIGRDHPLWRPYMQRHAQNHPQQYHNGGVWPLIGGFWVLALMRVGNPQLARGELVQLARLNELDGWRFTEWFHGKTLEPKGMAGQSWNAAAFLMARQAVEGAAAGSP